MLTKMNLSPICNNQRINSQLDQNKQDFYNSFQQFSILFTPTRCKTIPELNLDFSILSINENKKNLTKQKINLFDLKGSSKIKQCRSLSADNKKNHNYQFQTHVKEMLVCKNNELKMKYENITKKYKQNLKNQIIKDSRLYGLESDNKELIKQNGYLKASTIFMEQKFEEYVKQNQILENKLEKSLQKKILKSFFEQFTKKEASNKTKTQIIKILNDILKDPKC